MNLFQKFFKTIFTKSLFHKPESCLISVFYLTKYAKTCETYLKLVLKKEIVFTTTHKQLDIQTASFR